jgi:hypothetical protein
VSFSVPPAWISKTLTFQGTEVVLLQERFLPASGLRGSSALPNTANSRRWTAQYMAPVTPTGRPRVVCCWHPFAATRKRLSAANPWRFGSARKTAPILHHELLALGAGLAADAQHRIKQADAV